MKIHATYSNHYIINLILTCALVDADDTLGNILLMKAFNPVEDVVVSPDVLGPIIFELIEVITSCQRLESASCDITIYQIDSTKTFIAYQNYHNLRKKEIFFQSNDLQGK